VAGGKSKSHTLHTWLQLLFDTALATATTTAHTLILLTHAVTLSVAINSHTNAMLLVLISNNFGEIKGTCCIAFPKSRHTVCPCKTDTFLLTKRPRV
jgi:hypothetical protein